MLKGMRVSSGIQGELDLINRIFCDDEQSEEQILQTVEELYEAGEKNIYARLLHVMCHLRLAPAEARKSWQAILRHRDLIESKLGRKTGFRVAMLDYFVNESRDIKNPKVIEIHVYAETARQAAIDELTGVFNRRFFDNALERELKQASRRNREFSLLIVDIDNFKRVNDTHGHTTGDAVISALGKLLKRSIRSEDTPCRIGGEEFAVIFPETDPDGAMVVSEKIRSEFAKLKIAATDLSLSGGLATFPGDGKTAAELIDRADSGSRDPSNLNPLRAYLLLDQGRTEESALMFEKIIHVLKPRVAREGELTPYRSVLAVAYSRLGKLEEAERLLRHCLEISPDLSPLVVEKLSVVVYKQGRADEALAMLEHEAARVDGSWINGSQLVIYRLGSLYYQRGRFREARANLEKFLERTQSQEARAMRRYRAEAEKAVRDLTRRIESMPPG